MDPGLPSPNTVPAAEGTLRYQFDEIIRRSLGPALFTEQFKLSRQYRDLFRIFVAGYVIASHTIMELGDWPDQDAAQEQYRRRAKEIEGFGARLGEST